MKLINWIQEKFELNEVLKFLVGGGSAVVVDASVYVALKAYIDIAAAKSISYILGAVVGFIINKRWTFQSKKFKISEVFKYIILYVCFFLTHIYFLSSILW